MCLHTSLLGSFWTNCSGIKGNNFMWHLLGDATAENVRFCLLRMLDSACFEALVPTSPHIASMSSKSKEIVYACLFAYTEWNPIKSDVKCHLIPPCPAVSRIPACWIRITTNTRLCLENMYPCTVLKIMNAQLQYFWRLFCIIFRNNFFLLPSFQNVQDIYSSGGSLIVVNKIWAIKPN